MNFELRMSSVECRNGEQGHWTTGLRRRRGFSLLECAVYVGVLAVILSRAYAAFYRTLGNWSSLNRNAADIVRTLQTGERWRADVRAATAPPRLVGSPQEALLHVPQKEGEILYAFRDGAV